MPRAYIPIFASFSIMVVVRLLICMALGIALGVILQRRVLVLKVCGWLFSATVYLLLFLLGMALGEDHGLIAELSILGVQSLVLALLSMVFSIVGGWLFGRIALRRRLRTTSGGAGGKRKSLWSALTSSASYLLGFGLGLAVGYFLPIPAWVGRYDVSTRTLEVLMFFAGISVGGDVQAMRSLQQMSIHLLWLPLVTVVGTLVGSLCAWPMLDLNLRACVAVGCGYGYYSLSSVLITDGFRPERLAAQVGAIALVSNICREVLTIFLARPISRVFGPLGVICSAGATSMDTNLAFVVGASSPAYAVPSIYHGVVLSVWCPIAVGLVLML